MHKNNNTKWIIKDYAIDDVENIRSKLKISPLTARLLCNRGCNTPEEAEAFLRKDIADFADPYLMKDMRRAVDCIIAHLERKSKILIYGDYDVDGVTSTVVLYQYLKSIGADISYYIPERVGDGYGLNKNSISKFNNENVSLIITVDTGITANSEIDYAHLLGIDVIVTDHHTCLEVLPDAEAIVNPKQHDCNYPFKELAGVGVAFKLICALDSRYSKINVKAATNKIFEKFADIIAIGTIADVMPIRFENRIIVSYGLDKLSRTDNIGLSALLDKINSESKASKKKAITSALIGFVIAPRINAAGRMTSAMRAVELLVSENYAEAKIIAAELCDINKQRQLYENKIFCEAIQQIENTFDFDNDLFIVLENDHWHHGVIGIVASRICEKYHLPCIMVSFLNESCENADDVGKGSGRSIKGLNIFDALNSCNDLLIKFGGHELAAGLSLKRENLNELKKRLNDYSRKTLDYSSLSEKLYIDSEITPNDISIKTVNEISLLEPFGLSNPMPLFYVSDFIISEIISIGDGKHTKLILRKDNISVNALYFGMPYQQFSYCVGDRVDIACNMDINVFQNKSNVQLTVRSIRLNNSQMEPIRRRIEIYKMNEEGKTVFFSDENVPTRDDLKVIFLQLRKKATERKFLSTEIDYYRENDDLIPIDISHLSRYLLSSHKIKVSVLKILFAIDIFNELGILEKKSTGDDSIILFKILIKDGKKVDLENSKILNKLSNKKI